MIRYKSALKYLGSLEIVRIGLWLVVPARESEVALVSGAKDLSESRARALTNLLSLLGVKKIGQNGPNGAIET